MKRLEIIILYLRHERFLELILLVVLMLNSLMLLLRQEEFSLIFFVLTGYINILKILWHNMRNQILQNVYLAFLYRILKLHSRHNLILD